MTTPTLDRPVMSRAHQLSKLPRAQLLKRARDLAREATPETLCALAATLPDDTLVCAVLVLEDAEVTGHVAADV